MRNILPRPHVAVTESMVIGPADELQTQDSQIPAVRGTGACRQILRSTASPKPARRWRPGTVDGCSRDSGGSFQTILAVLLLLFGALVDTLPAQAQEMSSGLPSAPASVSATTGDSEIVRFEVRGESATSAQRASAGICGRTAAVRDAILANISDVTDCGLATDEHLAAITGTLDLSGPSITALAAGDFAGLTALTQLDLSFNNLPTLPAGVFAGLTALTELDLRNNRLTTLPAGVFDGLTALTGLGLGFNDLPTIPAGVFDNLTSLTVLSLDDNDLTTLPAGAFEPLTALTLLRLNSNPGAPFAPVAVALPDDGRVSDAGGAVTLNGNDSDGGPWGANVTYSWALTDPANGVTVMFDDAMSATPTVTVPALAADTELAFTLTVTGRGAGGLSNGFVPGTDTATVTTAGICGRTEAVQTAILAKISNVTVCDLVNNEHLAAIAGALDLSGLSITALAAGDFDGLTALTQLDLSFNNLPTLPAGVFDNLTSLSALGLDDNDLAALPSGVFDNLTSLTELGLNDNDLAALPSGVFDNLTSLSALGLDDNDLAALPPGVFDNLTSLSALGLDDNDLPALPPGVFDNLTSLTELYLEDNDLITLPADVFESLTSLTLLTLAGNPGASFAPVAVALYDDRAVTDAGGTVMLDGSGSDGGPWGANVAYSWALTAPANGVTVTFDDAMSATPVVTIPALEAGTQLTFTLTVTGRGSTHIESNGIAPDTDAAMVPVVLDPTARICGRTEAVQTAILAKIDGVSACALVTADHLAAITGTLDLSGLSITALAAGDFDGLTALTGLSLSFNNLTTLPAGVFEPLTALTLLRLEGNPGAPFAPAVVALPDDGTISDAGGTVMLNGSDGGAWGANVTYSWALTAPTSKVEVKFDDAMSATPVVTIPALTAGAELTFTLTVTGRGAGGLSDGFVPGTDTATVTTGICGRTAAVRDAILAQIPGVSDCGRVTDEHLAAISGTLSLIRKNITALAAGDFDGLTSLTVLDMRFNALTKLRADVFDDLTSLTELNLAENALIALPAGVFDDLTSLTELNLGDNALTTLPAGVFDDLTSLTELYLYDNALITLPAGVFDGLTLLTVLDLRFNALPTLRADVFDGPTSLATLWLSNNRLTALPAGVFDNLTSLSALGLYGNDLAALPSGVFDDLTSLTELYLAGNALITLPAGVLDDLNSLTVLDMGFNVLATLPAGVFDGLTALTELGLRNNRLTAVPAGVFDDLTSLTELILENNALSTLPSDVFEPLTSLTVLTLAGNPGASFAPVAVARYVDGTVTDAGGTVMLNGSSSVGGPWGANVTYSWALTDPVNGVIVTFDNVMSAMPVVTIPALTAGTELTFTLTVAGRGSTYSESNGIAPDTDAARVPVALDPTARICGRTEAVQTAILARIDSISACNLVTDEHLAAIAGAMDLSDLSITALAAGDFDGLSALTQLDLSHNDLPTLPAGVFAGLTALTELDLRNNRLTTLPAGVFDRLTALTGLGLGFNDLPTLPAGVFDNLTSLTVLSLDHNDLPTLPAGVFEPLTALSLLLLESNPGAPFMPAAVALPDDGTVSVGGGAVTLNGSGSDGGPWGTNVTYSWALTNPANGVTVMFDDAMSATPTVTVPALAVDTELAFTLTVTGRGAGGPSDGFRPGTDTATVTTVGICGRTEAVRTAILANISDVSDCGLVTDEHLAAIAGALDLSGLSIVALAAGDFDGLTALTFLDLSNNSLTRLFSGVFADLTSLRALGLYGNRLAALPSDAFDNLTSLTELYLHDNDLATLPADVFADLTSLTQLALSGNDLTALPSGVFEPLTALTQLNLADNPGVPFMPVAVALPDDGTVSDGGGAVTLNGSGSDGGPWGANVSYSWALTAPTSEVEVTFDDARSATPVVTIPTLTAGAELTFTLTVTGRGAGGRSDGFVPGTDTATVTAGICGRTAAVRDAILAQIPGASDCGHVTDEHLAAISGSVSLNSMNITALAAGDFAGLTALRELDLRYNRLTTLPAGVFDGLTALTGLGLGFNDLPTLPAGVFDNLTSLTVLSLDGNHLTTLPPGVFEPLTELTLLRLKSNPGAPFMPAAVALPDDGTVSDAGGAVTLNGSGSDGGPWGANVTYSWALTAPMSGVEVTFDDTRSATSVVTIPALMAGTELTFTLTVTGRGAGGLSDGFVPGTDTATVTTAGICGRTEAVQTAILANIVDVSDCGLVTDEHLAAIAGALDLSGLSITALAAGDFDGLTALTFLDLSNNSLTRLSSGVFADLTSLRALGLYGNGLAALPSDAFDNLTSLTELYLRDNELATLPADVFADLTSLTQLALSGNNLTALPSGVFEPLTALTQLNLADNPGVPFMPVAVALLNDGTISDAGGTVVLNGSYGGPWGANVTYSWALTAPTSEVEVKFDDAMSATPVVTIPALTAGTELTFTLTVTGRGAGGRSDGFVPGTDTATVTAGICGRTAAVRDAILAQIPGVSDCGLVTDVHLAAISGSVLLNRMNITALAAGDFAGLTALASLGLSGNDLATLPAGVFDRLTALTELDLRNNRLATLPAGVFEPLTALTSLGLSGNDLATLPAGVFEPLTALTLLRLEDNPGAPFMPVAVALYDGGAVSDAGGAVTLNGSGSDGGPWGANVTYSWALTDPANGVTVTFDDAMSATPVVTIPALTAGAELTFTLTVTGRGAGDHSDGFVPGTDTATLTTAGICGRTEAVQTAILAKISEVTDCALVTDEHLAAIAGALDLSGLSLTDLAAGDFHGLTSLTFLDLGNNSLARLPSGVFDNLTSLSALGLYDNNLAALPSDALDNLTSLTQLDLSNNRLTTLPAGVFADLTSLTQLKLADNPGAPFAPVAVALPDDGTVLDAGGPVMLNGSDGGPWGANVTYSWALTDPANGVTVMFDDARSATPVVTVSALTAGTELTFTLTVTGRGAGVLGDGFAPGTDTATVTATDNTAPIVTIGVPETSTTSFTATFTFSEPVTGFAVGDITLTNATASEFTEADRGTVFTARITPTETGVVTVDVEAGVATDAAGKGNTAAVQVSSTYALPVVAVIPVLDSVSEGAPADFVLIWNGETAAELLVTVTQDGEVLSSTPPTSVTLRAGSVYAFLSVSTVDDAVDEDAGAVTVTLMADTADPATYALGRPSEITATVIVTDDDTRGVTLSTASLTVAEGGTDTYTVVLNSAPTGPVTVTPSSDNTDVTLSPMTLTLTATNWNAAQTVAVTAAQDGDVSDDHASITHVVAGADYESETATAVTVTVTDDRMGDTTAPTVTISGVPETSTASFTATFTFTEPVTGFVVGDITLANATASEFMGADGGTSYTALITPTANGTVTVDVPAEKAADDAGNGNTAATGASSTYTAPVNMAPSFTSAAAFDAVENQTAVGTVEASDGDSDDAVSGYAIEGGADASEFTIDAATGVLTFVLAPNFEVPTDADGNNAYVVVVRATSGTDDREKTADQTITVTVTDVGGEAPGVPAAPTVASAGVSSVAVTWTVPVNAGPPVTDYDYQYRVKTPEGPWTEVTDTPITALSVTITQLVENTEYEVQVRAANDEGTSSWSRSGSGSTDANAAPSFTSAASFDAAENQTAAGTVEASDGDSDDAVSGYAIEGGADASEFTIDAATGVLAFALAPNFEVPSDDDGNNTYVVVVRATSGTDDREKTADQTITVTVTDVGGEAPGVPAAPTVASAGMSSVAVSWTVPVNTGPPVTDYDYQYRVKTPEGPWTGVTDTPITALSATVTQLVENTEYEVQVRAANAEGTSDWSESGSGSTDANAVPVFTSAASFDAAENQTAVGTVEASDGDSDDAVSGYAIEGGADASEFTIDAATGVLTFVLVPNFEDASDADGNNAYVVVVRATSGTDDRVKTADQTITVTVTDVGGEAPGVPAAPTVASAGVSSVAVSWTVPVNAGPPVTDYDYQYRVKTPEGPWTGVTDTPITALSVTITQLVENTEYEVQVRAANDEGTSSWSRSGSGSTDANAAPSFTSAAAFDAAENQTAVGTVEASDGDSDDAVSGYAIEGGADASEFTIDAATGVLTFVLAPNFEFPSDADGNNAYVVVVRATSGTDDREKTADQTITVTVTDVGGEAPGVPAAPTVASAGVSSVAVSWTVPVNAGPPVTDYDYQYRVKTPEGPWTGVTDTPITALSVTITQLVENTEYEVQVRAANDEGTSSWSRSGSGSTDANAAPSFTSAASFDAAENQTAVGTVEASDSDSDDAVSGYAIEGGADASEFTIDAATGVLAFALAPNFEVPSDDDGNNTYVVVVRATSGTDDREKTADQTITVTVTDVGGEAPGVPVAPTVASAGVTSVAVSWTVPVNAGPPVTDYDYQYRVKTQEGPWTGVTDTPITALSATVTQLVENTEYEVQVRAANAEGTSDWSESGSGSTDANAVPVFTSAASFDAAENQTAVGTVEASDSDGDDAVSGYAIEGGADASEFTIDAATGVLAFALAPNFEVPTDADGNNAYVVVVRATSGTDDRVKTADQTITVTVTDVGGEAPGVPAAPTVASAGVSSVAVSWTVPVNAGPPVTDYDYQYRVKTPEGPWTGVTDTPITALSVTITQLVENTEYEVQVRAANDEGTSSWSRSGSGSTDANAAPSFTSAASFDAAENQTAVGTVEASDGDSDDAVSGYAIDRGGDSDDAVSGSARTRRSSRSMPRPVCWRSSRRRTSRSRRTPTVTTPTWWWCGRRAAQTIGRRRRTRRSR